MLPSPPVSVIIPTYNRAKLLRRAIISVLKQTYSNLQIIVIDDGSTDNTKQIVSEFENVEYYYQENKRQAAARNLGLEKSTGKYIASLDSDDCWHESFISESVKCLEKNNVDFVFANWVYEQESIEFQSDWYRSKIWKKYRKQPQDIWFLLNSEESRRLFIETCPAPSSSLVIRKDALVSPWNPEMIIADDWCVILDMVLNKPCTSAFTLKSLWVKERHKQNIYDGQDRINITKQLGFHDETLLSKRFQSLLMPNEKKVFKLRMARHHFNFGIWSILKLQFSSASFKSLVTSLIMSPIGITTNILKRIKIRFTKNRSFSEITQSVSVRK